MGSLAASPSPSAPHTPAGDLPLAVCPCANTSPFHARRAFTALVAGTGLGEEDATIMPTGPLGAWYAVGLGGRFLGEARDLKQALGMLRAAMDADRVWPDIWCISDHGNPQRLEPGGHD